MKKQQLCSCSLLSLTKVRCCFVPTDPYDPKLVWLPTRLKNHARPQPTHGRTGGGELGSDRGAMMGEELMTRILGISSARDWRRVGGMWESMFPGTSGTSERMMPLKKWTIATDEPMILHMTHDGVFLGLWSGGRLADDLCLYFTLQACPSSGHQHRSATFETLQ